ncbi:MAG: hypothetical protein CMM93_06875 [Rickettsiales bacterium]|nr:hypothetical protein [Rickettsiales bacterium]|tara:strand:- start:841 stop:1152 length:312 start_codon:yes stop_codon:yes gene_type:complete
MSHCKISADSTAIELIDSGIKKIKIKKGISKTCTINLKGCENIEEIKCYRTDQINILLHPESPLCQKMLEKKLVIIDPDMSHTELRASFNKIKGNYRINAYDL